MNQAYYCAILVGMFTLVGTLGGVVLTHRLHSTEDRRKHLIINLRDAYSDWSGAVLRLLWERGRWIWACETKVSPAVPDERRELAQGLFEAKVRVTAAHARLLLLETDSKWRERVQMITRPVIVGGWDSRLGIDEDRKLEDLKGQPTPSAELGRINKLEKAVEQVLLAAAEAHPLLCVSM